MKIKTKFNFKILLLVSILLITMCLFNTTMVQATNETVEGRKTTNETTSTTGTKTDTTKAITIDENTLDNYLPTNLTVAIKEVDYEEHQKSRTAIKEAVEKELTNKGVVLESKYSLDVSQNEINEATIYLNDSSQTTSSAGVIWPYKTIAKKTINIKYSNSKDYNETDKKYVINVANKLDEKIYRLFNIGTEITYIEDEESVYNFIMDILNDTSIEIHTVSYGSRYECGVEIRFYKNDIFYLSKRVTIYTEYGFELSNGIPVTMTTIEKDNNVYKEMVSKLTEKGYTNIFAGYELKLQENYDGDIPVTFSLGTENNGKQAMILHKKADGSYEEFIKTVKDGKIDITVSELSPFMIALTDTTNTNNANDNNTNDKKLDNEPKTGVADYTIFASAVALISLGGIVTLKFKK